MAVANGRMIFMRTPATLLIQTDIIVVVEKEQETRLNIHHNIGVYMLYYTEDVTWKSVTYFKPISHCKVSCTHGILI